jgi:hypothetical protein
MTRKFRQGPNFKKHKSPDAMVRYIEHIEAMNRAAELAPAKDGHCQCGLKLSRADTQGKCISCQDFEQHLKRYGPAPLASLAPVR